MSTKIIGLTGKAGSGKSTVALWLTTPHAHHPHGREAHFAAPIKAAISALGLFPWHVIHGASAERATRHPTLGFTAREALQRLGTEWGRALHPDIWATLGVERALELLARRDTSHVVISDVRFTNEARAIVAAGGEVWRIQRPGAGLTGAAAEHPSETEMDTDAFTDYVARVVHNTGSLDDLRAGVLRAARHGGITV